MFLVDSRVGPMRGITFASDEMTQNSWMAYVNGGEHC
jgi:hypothetical protein